MATLFTIGHSNHPFDRFAGLLAGHGVDCLVDVRAIPYSRRFPQFRKDALQAALGEKGIDYRWMGERLGGLRHREGATTFEDIARRADFRAGLDELEALAARRTPAIMCAEREPMDCHRTILVTRHLRGRDLDIRHILADGGAETNTTFEERLFAAAKTGPAPLLETPDQAVESAYASIAKRMAGRGSPGLPPRPGPRHTQG
jgi:uncharacterized protein (DUF488 family)